MKRITRHAIAVTAIVSLSRAGAAQADTDDTSAALTGVAKSMFPGVPPTGANRGLAAASRSS